MVEQSFTATVLWQSTLASGARHDDHSGQRERLRMSYLSLRDNAAFLLAETARSTPNFTVHDIAHVDALWETASLVCGDRNSLTPAEAYVLGCAFVLHDAAMGLAAYREGLPEAIGQQRWKDLIAIEYFKKNECWPREGELDSPADDIIESCIVQAIRECHAAHAARLVDQPWATSAGNQIYLIQDVHLREAYGPLIGELAASHWWNVNVLANRFKQAKGSLPWQPADWIIEPLKLACILRLADATQIDSRRAPTFLFTLRRPQGESYHHWRFQEHISRPQLSGDRVTYTSLRPFGRDAAEAWWLALDYLRQVDRELKSVDALLHDLGRMSPAARAVAGVDSPERFAELFPVAAWRPVDAVLEISDVPALVGKLGGEQLYGNEPEVAVRELIQNAQDAVLARAGIDPDFTDGVVNVRLIEDGNDWFLEVCDNGIGMDEDIIAHSLLDFGRSGWSSNQIRTKFPGLAGSGFRPNGRFGIGFFSVFMLGDRIDLVTRRYDGAYADARHLAFNGLGKRPMLAALDHPARAPHGTMVRVRLKVNPYDPEGILKQTENDQLAELVQRLAIETSVPIRSLEPGELQHQVHLPCSLEESVSGEIFDRLYPPVADSWRAGREKLRLEVREAFAQRATDLFDDKQRRIGLAAIGSDLWYLSQADFRGVIPVNGLLADESIAFMGYIDGMPNRASRNKVDLAAKRDEVRRWITSQEDRLRDIGEFSASIQLELAYTMYRALGGLAKDHAIGFIRQGVIQLGNIEKWAIQRDEIFLARGMPLAWNTRPPSVMHFLAGVEVTLPEDWILLCVMYNDPTFVDMFPLKDARDPKFAFARSYREHTWEKLWWRFSGLMEGELLRQVCRAWSCEIRDLLAPVAQRHGGDVAYLDDASLGPVFGYRLNRPST